MATGGTVNGLSTVLANLGKANSRMADGCNRGLRMAGIYLQGQSMRLVPVDYGNLKASAFTRAFGKGFQTQVVMGYTAAYALHVHELVAMKLKGQPRPSPHKGRYWDPQGRAQAKFLEDPFYRGIPVMRKMIADEIKK